MARKITGSCDGCIHMAGERRGMVTCRKYGVSPKGLLELRLYERPNHGCREKREGTSPRPVIVEHETTNKFTFGNMKRARKAK